VIEEKGKESVDSDKFMELVTPGDSITKGHYSVDKATEESKVSSSTSESKGAK